MVNRIIRKRRASATGEERRLLSPRAEYAAMAFLSAVAAIYAIVDFAKNGVVSVRGVEFPVPISGVIVIVFSLLAIILSVSAYKSFRGEGE